MGGALAAGHATRRRRRLLKGRPPAARRTRAAPREEGGGRRASDGRAAPCARDGGSRRLDARDAAASAIAKSGAARMRRDERSVVLPRVDEPRGRGASNFATAGDHAARRRGDAISFCRSPSRRASPRGGERVGGPAAPRRQAGARQSNAPARGARVSIRGAPLPAGRRRIDRQPASDTSRPSATSRRPRRRAGVDARGGLAQPRRGVAAARHAGARQFDGHPRRSATPVGRRPPLQRAAADRRRPRSPTGRSRREYVEERHVEAAARTRSARHRARSRARRIAGVAPRPRRRLGTRAAGAI